jgi:hypothetical protein
LVTESIPGNQFISGVYNYCDRFCERCLLIRKCRVYAEEKVRTEQHRRKGEDPHDWAIVLDDVKKEFDKTMKLIRAFAQKEGIDLESVPDSEISSLPDPSDYPLDRLSREYMNKTGKFLTNCREKIEKFGRDLEVCGGITNGSVIDLKRIITDYETVLWYHTLIPVKIRRGLTSKLEAEENSASDGDFDDLSAGDAAGSAKVAYYGLVRSISALQVLYEWDRDDDTLTYLALADRLRQMLDKEIPEHRSFRHPWFDAHPLR